VQQAPAPAPAQDPGFEKTVVHQATAATAPADAGFEKTVVHQAAPATKHEDGFEKTVVHQVKKPGEPSPPAGGGTVPDVEI
jgi:hypothetical protein